MKKVHWFVLLLCLVSPVFQSCDDGDGYSIGDFTPPLWATVRVGGGAFYLDCDVWGTLWPVNTDMGWYTPVDGQRVITYFNPLWDNYEGYDHAVKIISISGGYMNIIFLQNLPAKEKHRISLVRPQDDAELYGEDGYVHLELRYNDYDDVTGYGNWGAVSYNLSSLNFTDATKGIKLKLNSSVNGEVEVAFDFVSSDDEGEGSSEKGLQRNVDLSKVQLK